MDEEGTDIPSPRRLPIINLLNHNKTTFPLHLNDSREYLSRASALFSVSSSDDVPISSTLDSNSSVRSCIDVLSSMVCTTTWRVWMLYIHTVLICLFFSITDSHKQAYQKDMNTNQKLLLILSSVIALLATTSTSLTFNKSSSPQIRVAVLPKDLPAIQECRRTAYAGKTNLLAAARSFCNADQM